MLSTLVKRGVTALAVAGVLFAGGAATALATTPEPSGLGPLQQGTGLFGLLQQTEQARSSTWTVISTIADPNGMMIGSPVSAYGQTDAGSFGCFLFLCSYHPK